MFLARLRASASLSSASRRFAVARRSSFFASSQSAARDSIVILSISSDPTTCRERLLRQSQTGFRLTRVRRSFALLLEWAPDWCSFKTSLAAPQYVSVCALIVVRVLTVLPTFTMPTMVFGIRAISAIRYFNHSFHLAAFFALYVSSMYARSSSISS